MSEEENVLQVDFIEDAAKDGAWYQIMYPNNYEACIVQLVKWDDNYDLWLALMVQGGGEDPNCILLLEDGSRWSETITVV